MSKLDGIENSSCYPFWISGCKYIHSWLINQMRLTQYLENKNAQK